jgi:hypothetical protein
MNRRDVATKFLSKNLTEGKWTLGRPRPRWKDNIKMERWMKKATNSMFTEIEMLQNWFMWYWFQDQTAEKTLVWERPMPEIRGSLTHSVVLDHKSFWSQSFVLTAGLLHHAVGSHRARGTFKDPPCIKHSGGRDQTGTTFVAGAEHKIPLWWNLSDILFEPPRMTDDSSRTFLL